LRETNRDKETKIEVMEEFEIEGVNGLK